MPDPATLKKRQKISDRLPLNREKIALLLAAVVSSSRSHGHVCVDFILSSFPDWHVERRAKRQIWKRRFTLPLLKTYPEIALLRQALTKPLAEEYFRTCRDDRVPISHLVVGFLVGDLVKSSPKIGTVKPSRYIPEQLRRKNGVVTLAASLSFDGRFAFFTVVREEFVH